MSQHRTDRPVVGGRRATCGGRGQALAARGWNQVTVLQRTRRVLELRAAGRSFRSIAVQLGVSRTTVWRDWQAAMAAANEAALGRQLLGERLLAPGRPLPYRVLAERHDLPVATVRRMVRTAAAALDRRTARPATPTPEESAR